MKKIILAAMALAALAACNKAEVISAPEGEAIEFANPFIDNATKATDKTYSGDKALTAFNLYGTVTGTAGTINIYNGCNVTGEVGNDVWNCPVNQYWIGGAKYNFAAVADGTVASFDANGMPLTITCNTAVDANNVQKDLLYVRPAEITALASGNGPVNLVFNHLLAKAQFTVTSTTEGDYYYSVTNINIENYVDGTYVLKAGTYTLNGIEVNVAQDNTWVGTGDKANTGFGNIEQVRKTNPNNGKTCDFQRLLIPNTDAIKVTFTVELWNANGTNDTAADDVKLSTENKTFTVTQKLLAGNAYDFKIDLSVGELIQFTVTQKPTWNPAEGGTGVTLQ